MHVGSSVLNGGSSTDAPSLMIQNPVLSELLQCDSAITVAVNTHEDTLSVCWCHVISEHRHCIHEFVDFNSSRPICIEPPVHTQLRTTVRLLMLCVCMCLCLCAALLVQLLLSGASLRRHILECLLGLLCFPLRRSSTYTQQPTHHACCLMHVAAAQACGAVQLTHALLWLSIL